MIVHLFILSSEVQMYEFLYIHCHNEISFAILSTFFYFYFIWPSPCVGPEFTRRTKSIRQKRLEWCTKFHATNVKRYTSVKQGDSWVPGLQNTERKQKISPTGISQDPPAEPLLMSTINQP